MKLDWLASFGSFSRFAAASLVLTTALRFSFVAWGTQPKRPAPPSGFAAPSTEAARASPSASGAPTRGGREIRVRMTVDVGGDRAEVFVNGTRRGQVPWVGELTCAEGSPLAVEVVPKSGAKLSYPRVCDRAILQIR